MNTCGLFNSLLSGNKAIKCNFLATSWSNCSLIVQQLTLHINMLVTIARFSFPYEAQIAWAKLDAEGIPAFIADEHTINMQWLYSNALGGVRLQVPEEYAEQAQRILSENRAHDLVTQEGSSSLPCPQCGSSDTEYYQYGKRCAFLVFLCIDFPLYPVKHGIKCNHCGYKTKL